MKKAMAFTVVLSMLFLGIPAPTDAGAVAGLATEWTQILNHVQLIMGYIRQGLQLENELKQYEEELKQGLVLPQQVFGPICAAGHRLHRLNCPRGSVDALPNSDNLPCLVRVTDTGGGEYFSDPWRQEPQSASKWCRAKCNGSRKKERRPTEGALFVSDR
jgi:hypothetical protein